jgi:hypothetical protein
MASPIPRRRALSIREILLWADAYREAAGPGMDSALRYNKRGLPGESSLAKLLAEPRPSTTAFCSTYLRWLGRRHQGPAQGRSPGGPWYPSPLAPAHRKINRRFAMRCPRALPR